MATDSDQRRDLRNDTAVNVVALLKAQTGETRSYELTLGQFASDGEVIGRAIVGEVQLTRLSEGIMARVRANGLAPLICARCLRQYEEPIAIEFAEEYRQTVDVRTGFGLGSDLLDEDLVSRIDDNHELDLGEALRQEILVALPMRPDCGPACAGPDLLEVGASDEADDVIVDTRFADLARLLADEAARESERPEPIGPARMTGDE